jgi:hypothetical protein
MIDCGAATSVISYTLCEKLDLKPNGDSIRFINQAVVQYNYSCANQNIGGHTRMEHCCIQPPSDRNNVDPRLYRKVKDQYGNTIKSDRKTFLLLDVLQVKLKGESVISNIIIKTRKVTRLNNVLIY